MAIKKFEMQTAICDNCKNDVLGDSDFSCVDSDYLQDTLSEANWQKIDDKHYCEDCWSYDDNDNIVLTNNHN